MSYYGSSKTRAFISFDVDHDEGTKTMLAGQAKQLQSFRGLIHY